MRERGLNAIGGKEVLPKEIEIQVKLHPTLTLLYRG